jgi:hypothetical protein
VASAPALDPAYVHAARDPVEGRSDLLEPLGPAQIRRGMIEQPDVVHVLRRDQMLEELDDARVPPGDVARQLLQHGGCSLAPAKRNGMRHLGARARDPGRNSMQPAIADQVADVRHDPFGAGLDELVVIELVEILFEHGDLLGQDTE